MKVWNCRVVCYVRKNSQCGHSLSKETIETLHLHNFSLVVLNHRQVPLWTKQQLIYTRWPSCFAFLNLACNSADALYNFAPAVMVTVHPISSVRFMHRDLCDLGSQILIRILIKERNLRVRSFGRIKISVFDPRSPNDPFSDPSTSVIWWIPVQSGINVSMIWLWICC